LLGPTIGRRTELQGLRHPTAVRKPFARLSFSAILILPSVDDSWGNPAPNNNSNNGNNNNDTSRNSRKAERCSSN
jgi:hypothetical protein